ncbi:ExeA family protein [Thermogutta sp.]|uniref:ExeA family protein n=1 Tax=Thermogutta sp. TaxID=1962930 RepID=UPI003C7E9E8B
MYEQFFGFKQRPFPASCHPRYYIPLEAVEAAREKLVRAVLRAEGPGLIIGPTGTGKSMLLQVVAQQLQSRCEVVLLAHGRFPNVRAVLQAILCELRQPFRGMDEGELRLNLVEYLRSLPSSRPLALLVDEADTLSFRVLEEIRTLLNVMSGEDPAVRLVLAGGTALEERLTAPKLQVLSQRITARCYLDALNRSDTFFYIEQQIKRAGQSPVEIFPEKTCEAVYHATGGVLRLINQVCDHALILAFADGLKTVTPELVQEAWSDLQQFPIPWDPVPRSAGASSVVEFGSWSDIGSETVQDLAADLSGGGSSIPAEPVERQGWRDPEAQSLTGPHGEPDRSPLAHESSESFEIPTDLLTGSNTSKEVLEGVSDREPPDGLKDRPDPVARINDVVATVSELEREMSPQAKRTPEVELIFYDWGDPFAETFSQEIQVSPRAPVTYGSEFKPQTGLLDVPGNRECASSIGSSAVRHGEALPAKSGGMTEPSVLEDDNQTQIGRADDSVEKSEKERRGCASGGVMTSSVRQSGNPPSNLTATASIGNQEAGEVAQLVGTAENESENTRSSPSLPTTGGWNAEQGPDRPEIGATAENRDAEDLASPRGEQPPRDVTRVTTPQSRRRFKSLFSQLRNAQ